jgi:phosphotransferase system  glucose/maltose/N-acetylglucosamine-specific IIC component
MADYSCPKCGRALIDLQLPGYCEGCGQHLGPPPHAERTSHFWRVFLTVAEFLALGLAVVVRSNGAPFLGALLVIVFVNVVAATIYVIWQKAILPSAKGIEERGLVGISKSIYEKLLAPLLYGKERSGVKRQ